MGLRGPTLAGPTDFFSKFSSGSESARTNTEACLDEMSPNVWWDPLTNDDRLPVRVDIPRVWNDGQHEALYKVQSEMRTEGYEKDRRTITNSIFGTRHAYLETARRQQST